MDEMGFPKLSTTTSLLTEHFTYTPLTLIDDIIDTVNALVYTNISGIETALLSVSPITLGFEKRAAAEGIVPAADENGIPLYPEASQEIEEGVQKLETLLEATVDKNFDKLEIAALRTILNVPEGLEGWVRLGHYEGLDFVTRPDAPTPESVHLLRRKVQETRKLHSALLAEQSRNTAVIAQLRAMLAPAATAIKASPTSSTTKLEQTSSEPADAAAVAPPPPPSFASLAAAEGARTLGITFDAAAMKQQCPLTTSTKAALSQIPALKELVATLRPHIASLPSATLDGGEAGRKREERRAYIDGRVKRGLEKKGLPSEVDGEHGGDGVVMGALGRKVGRDEVRSLEQVVRAFGVEGFERRDDEDRMEH